MFIQSTHENEYKHTDSDGSNNIIRAPVVCIASQKKYRKKYAMILMRMCFMCYSTSVNKQESNKKNESSE